MNEIEKLIADYQLGRLLAVPEEIPGGFLHEVWRAQTSKGQYSIKRYLPNHATNLPMLLAAQEIARQLKQQDFLVATALMKNNLPYDVIAGNYYLVTPWIDGAVLSNAAVSAQQASIIGQLLAQIHTTQLSIPNTKLSSWPQSINEPWESLLQQSQMGSLNEILSWQSLYQKHQHLLTDYLVIGHRDLYQANVVWSDAITPYIIDWEGAGLINPLVELFGVALNWAGITKQFNAEIYRTVIEAYANIVGKKIVIDETIIYAGMGSWLNWLVFNLKRVLGIISANPRQLKVAKEQIEVTVKTLRFVARVERVFYPA